MSQELIYTSVPRGLRPGATGFCTVAMTAGMPAALAERLELLGGYRPVFPLGDPQVDSNPIIWAHWVVIVAGQARNVLSRVAFAGADYSSRSNKFAHHLVVDPAERALAGPAWVLGRPGTMKTTWDQEPRLLSSGPAFPKGDRPPARCAAWADAVGDAGWAGVLADAFRNDPAKPAYLIFRPGVDLLPLIAESLALLPPALRWRVTFSTYFTELPMETTCVWRCVVAGTPAAKEAFRAGSRALLIDLTKPLAAPPETPLTEGARTGRVSAGTAAPARAAPVSPPEDVGAPIGLLPITQYAGGPGAPIPPDRSRRRLVAVEVEEDQVEDPQFDVLHETSAVAADIKPAAVRRGVRPWVAALIALVCLGGGVGIGYGIATATRSSASNTLVTSPVKPDTAADEQQNIGVPKEPKAPDPSTPNPQGPPQNGSSFPALTIPGVPQPSAPAPTTPPGARTEAPSKHQDAAQTRSSGPQKGHHADQTDGDILAILVPVKSGPLESPTVSRVGGPAHRIWSIQGVDHIDGADLLFPNGERKYDRLGNDDNVKTATITEEQTVSTTGDHEVVLAIRIEHEAVDGTAVTDCGTFRISDGMVDFAWAAGKSTGLFIANQKFADHVQRTIELSALVLKVGGRKTAGLALVPCNDMTCEMKHDEVQSLVELAPGVPNCMRFKFPQTVAEGWTLAASSDTSAKYTKPFPGNSTESGEFSLTLTPSSRAGKGFEVRSDWPETRSRLDKQLDDARKGKRDAKAAIEGLNRQFEKKDRGSNPYIIQMNEQRAKIAACDQAHQNLQAYESLKTVRITVSLRNEMPLGTITVLAPDTEKPDTSKSGE